jgi:hypothetical protein
MISTKEAFRMSPSSSPRLCATGSRCRTTYPLEENRYVWLLWDEDLYYRGALIPKLHGLFGKWAWLAGGIIWLLKHVYVWWRFIPDAGSLGLVGAYTFGPLGSLPVTMLMHLIPNYGLSLPLVLQAVFGGG